jgi:hypothetical protein
LFFPVLLFAALFLASIGRVKTRTSSDTTGFTVWPDRIFQVLTYTGLVVLIPASMVMAYFIPRGEIDIPMSRGMQIFSPGLFVALVVIATGAVIAGIRRGGVGYIKLTPAMIEIADALRTTSFEWDDVVDIADRTDSKERRRSARALVLELRDGSEKVVGGLNFYVPQGAPLYWMIRHYWRHPEDRVELVDARAPERLRAGRFDLT